MENFGCWVDFELLKGIDARFAPALALSPINLKHVIRKFVAKLQRIWIWFWTW